MPIFYTDTASIANLQVSVSLSGGSGHVLTYNTSSGVVSFTSSAAIGGGSGGPESDPIFTARSASLATTGSNTFRGNQIVSGSLIATGSVANRSAMLASGGLYISRTSDGTYPSSITAEGNMFFDTRNGYGFRSDGTPIFTAFESGEFFIGRGTQGDGSGTTGIRVQISGSGASGSFKVNDNLFISGSNTIVTGSLDVSGSGRFTSYLIASSGPGKIAAYNDAVYIGGGTVGSSLRMLSSGPSNASNILFYHDNVYAAEIGTNLAAGRLIINPTNNLGLMISGDEKVRLVSGSTGARMIVNFTSSFDDNVTNFQVSGSGRFTNGLTVSGSLNISGAAINNTGFVLTYNTSTGLVSYTSSAGLGGGGGPESDPVFTATSASLATTGSNSFFGNQNVSGSTTITGSLTVTGSTISLGIIGGNAPTLRMTTSGFDLGGVIGGTISYAGTNILTLGQTVRVSNKLSVGGFNTTVVTDNRLNVKGYGTGSSTINTVLVNSSDRELFKVLDDGNTFISGGLYISGAAVNSTGFVLTYNTASGLVSYTSSAGLGGGGTPGGSTEQIQYNNAGAFSGVPTLTYNGTELRATGSFTGSFSGSLSGTASFATTSSFTLSSSFATTASISNNSNLLNNTGSSVFATTGSNTFRASQTISGSLTVTNDLIVLGSSSIQFISSSQLNIGTNIITVNAFSPTIRYGGLTIFDSGSSPLVSASILYDSLQDEFIFAHRGNTSSVFLQGPETFGGLGTETYITTNRIVKSQGNEHLTGSNITDTGTIVSINSNTQITGSLNVSGSITGSLFGTASFATSASFTLSSSFATTASFYRETDPVFSAVSASFATTGSNTFRTDQTISGSLTVTSSLSVFGNEFVVNSTGVKLGNVIGDTHTLTGSLNVSGSITASLFGTASFAATSSNILGGTTHFIPLWNTSTTLSSSILYQTQSGIGIGAGTVGSIQNSKLWVAGGAHFGGSTDGLGLRIGDVLASNTNISSSFTQSLIVVAGSNTGTNGNPATLAGDLIIQPRSDLGGANNFATRFYFKGIERSRFDENGLLVRSGSIIVSGSTTVAGGDFSVVTGSTNYLKVFPGGNVFVGPTAVDGGFRLDVNGTTRIQNTFTVAPSTTTEFEVASTGVKIGSVIGDRHGVTGSVGISGSLTASLALISTSGAVPSSSVLSVFGSGSDYPVFVVRGSQGELFSVTDSLTGSLFSVNNISGLPILEVFSDNTTKIGPWPVGALYTTNRIVANTGVNTVYTIQTASYDAMYVDYHLQSASLSRIGSLSVFRNGSTAQFVEANTSSFGSTTGLIFSSSVVGGDLVLHASASSNTWIVKTIIKAI